MINVLIVSKSISCCKNLIYNVINQNEELKIVGVATNKKEMNKVVSEINVDIILMNVKQLEINEYTNSKVIKENVKPCSIIVISDENIKQNKCINKYIYEYANYKADSFEDIIRTINNLVNIKITPKFLDSKKENFEDIIKEKIKKELKYLGYNFYYKGTKYLVDAIYILYNMKDYYNKILKRDIYPIISKKYNTSINNIKCNIRNATDIMFFDCNEYRLMEYLKECSLSKIGAKKVILAILDHIK